MSTFSSWIHGATVMMGFIVLSLLPYVMLTKTYQTIEEYEGCVENDHCVCQVSGDSPAYMSLKTKLEDLQSHQELLDTHQLYTQIVNLTSWIDQIQTDLTTQNAVQETIKRLSEIKQITQTISNELGELKQNESLHEQEVTLRSGFADFEAQMHKLWPRKTEVPKEELQRLAHKPGTFFEFPGDSLPINSSFDQDWCVHQELDSLDEPITHKWIEQSKSGSWFKDPLPVTEVNKTQIWCAPSYNGAFHVYNTYEDLGMDTYYKYSSLYSYSYISRNSHYSRDIEREGLGSILYKGKLFVPESYGNTMGIYRWEPNRKSVLSNFKIQEDQCNYQYLNHRDATFIDLKVDELGLWAIYATEHNSKKLVVSRLDPESLEFLDTFQTNKLKEHVCLSFMVCGRMYTIDICNAGRPPDIPYLQYTYDTIQGKDGFQRLHITSKYGNVVQLTYNPRERLLFGWDNGHLVTYNIKWRLK